MTELNRPCDSRIGVLCTRCRHAFLLADDSLPTYPFRFADHCPHCGRFTEFLSVGPLDPENERHCADSSS